jgi:ADP-ribosylglycohydrolase
MPLTDRDAARGVMLGLALGDALGWPVEFMERPEIRARYGREGITVPPDPALVTDDTQMSAAVAEALTAAGEAGLDGLMPVLAREFIAWKNDPLTASRAPGVTCIRGVNALEAGAPWDEAGVKDSKGCGSVMRVAPVGYFYQNSPEQLKTIARAQSWLTHRHPAADAACVGGASLIQFALDGVAPEEFPARVLAVTEGLSDELDAAIRRIGHVLAWSDEESALGHIGPTRGGGWIAEEALAMALYCVLKHPDDYRAAVVLGANISGDSDTVASIAGGILGARLGPQALPADWVERLENRDYYLGLADRLADKKAEMHKA